MEIIDVTLRDGGHVVDFDWPIEFAKDYYKLLSSFPDVGTIELGYWGQTAKTANRFYNLNFEKVLEVTQSSQLNNVSIMIDYHYCSHNVNDYPTVDQQEISMIRMCSRKEDMDDATIFGKKLKEHTGLNVSFNIFNSTNYSIDELLKISNMVKDWPFDYIYFADTHGSLDLSKDWDKFIPVFQEAKNYSKRTGFHLHDHSGMAMSNYKELLRKSYLVDSTDTSIKGMGKGSGNLKLEHVVSKDNLGVLAEFMLKYDYLLQINPSPYELITAKYGITDNYAKEAIDRKISIANFDKLCNKIHNVDKDTYSKKVFNE